MVKIPRPIAYTDAIKLQAHINHCKVKSFDIEDISDTSAVLRSYTI